jgi:hypothetical protein
MPAQVDMVNRALQTFGSRTTVTAAELGSNGSNEAIQANLIYVPFRRRLLRLAPWQCAFQTANLTYISSVPGTPENTSPATQLWAKGQPVPPWAYEYQYPVDCIRMCWITPQTATGFASGIPITTAVTGGAPTFWQGPPVKYTTAIDQFFGVTAAAPVAGGTGYAIGDQITLAQAPQGSAPLGAPAVLSVTSIGGGGSVTGVSVVNVIRGEGSVASPVIIGGSYFTNLVGATQAQGSTTGAGTGATFTLTQNTTSSDQRIILTNQEFAIGNYVRDVTDEAIFDDDFQEAFAFILGGALCKALTGDKAAANFVITQGNSIINVARGNDGNEGLRVNDVTPDWLRIRGIDYVEDYSGPYNTGFNWGAIWPGYT